MHQTIDTHRTIEISLHIGLFEAVRAFLIDKKATKSPGTLKFYQDKMREFSAFCDSQAVTDAQQITSTLLREYLLHLQEQDRTPGGVHAHWRAVKAFVRWTWDEFEIPTKVPTAKVTAPKVPDELLPAVELPDVDKLLKACTGTTAARDKAILCTLLDTGLRANELLSLNCADVDAMTGTITVHAAGTKSKKARTAYLGKNARKALRRYLAIQESSTTAALFLSTNGDRLTYDGLRAVITRRSKQAGIPAPSLHAFRRAFAVNMLRAGTDIYTLKELMGHADLQVLQRYLKLDDTDMHAAHVKNSPADKLRGA